VYNLFKILALIEGLFHTNLTALVFYVKMTLNWGQETYSQNQRLEKEKNT